MFSDQHDGHCYSGGDTKDLRLLREIKEEQEQTNLLLKQMVDIMKKWE
jgi:hypothetical protein